MKKIGLYFGTFNPIHIGHLIIANHLAEFSDLDEVWLVVSPQNPFKKKKTLLEDHHRLEMVYRATEDYPKLKPSNIEFSLPQPSYTVTTLAHLEERYPELQFALIMGQDNLETLHKWKNSEIILERYPVYVYPRLGAGKETVSFPDPERLIRVEAPVMELSSTFIREQIKAGRNIRPMLPEGVWQYIDEMNFYKK